ncbi:MAG: hypothetical protein ACRC9R_11690 [Enterovibrio sp.]
MSKIGGPPSKAFFERFFGDQAKEVQSLQQAARTGRISINGAKKLIKLHKEFGYELNIKFKKYLMYVISKENRDKQHVNPKTPEATAAPNTPNQEQSTTESPDPTSVMPEMPDDIHVTLGIAEKYRDERGRVQIRWIDKDKMEQTITADDEIPIDQRSSQIKNEVPLPENSRFHKMLQRMRNMSVSSS